MVKLKRRAEKAFENDFVKNMFIIIKLFNILNPLINRLSTPADLTPMATGIAHKKASSQPLVTD